MVSFTAPRQRGFTLVELLVVIAIIGILVALLLPAVQAAREAARRTECTNHLKQVGIALQTYHDVRKEFPTGRNRRNQFAVSWAYYILPQLEEQAVHDSFDKTKRVDDADNSAAMRTPIATYACPSRRSPAADRNFDNDDSPPQVLAAASLGDYAGNAGLEYGTGLEGNGFVAPGVIDLAKAGPIFTASKISARKVFDGLSKTLAVGERHIPPVDPDWPEEEIHYEQGDTAFLAGDQPRTIFAGTKGGLAEDEYDESNDEFGGPHPGVTLFVYLDGHVAALANSIEDESLMALSTVGGEEIVQDTL